MTDVVWSYLAALVLLLVGDAAWLSYFGKKIFRPTVGAAALEKPRWFAAVLFYPLFAAAIMAFPFHLAAGSIALAAAYGPGFGVAAYATYNLTNLATLKPWTATLALVDIAWGAFLTGVASAGAVMLPSLLG